MLKLKQKWCTATALFVTLTSDVTGLLTDQQNEAKHFANETAIITLVLIKRQMTN